MEVDVTALAQEHPLLGLLLQKMAPADAERFRAELRTTPHTRIPERVVEEVAKLPMAHRLHLMMQVKEVEDQRRAAAAAAAAAGAPPAGTAQAPATSIPPVYGALPPQVAQTAPGQPGVGVGLLSHVFPAQQQQQQQHQHQQQYQQQYQQIPPSTQQAAYSAQPTWQGQQQQPQQGPGAGGFLAVLFGGGAGSRATAPQVQASPTMTPTYGTPPSSTAAATAAGGAGGGSTARVSNEPGPLLNFLGGALSTISNVVSAMPQAGAGVLPSFPDAILTEAQKLQFCDQGYLHLTDVVPYALRKRALAAINKRLGSSVPSDQLELFKLAKGGLGFWPDLSLTPIITDLLNRSAALTYAMQLLGPVYPTWVGQIALRFPGDLCIEKSKMGDMAPLLGLQKTLFGHEPALDMSSDTDFAVPRGWERAWHVDGIMPGKQTIMQFSMLLGVLLSDADQDLCGNLTVFPGSHYAIQDWVRQGGDPTQILHSTIVDTPLQVAFPQPAVQLKGKAGDVFLCHWQLAHSVAPNVTPNIRYAVYFRLVSRSRPRAECFRPETMSDVWLEWEGVRALGGH